MDSEKESPELVKTQDTKNIKLVAYLRLNGIHPDSVEKLSFRKGKYYYEMPEKEWMEWKQKFDRSPEFAYAQSLDAVMSLIY